MTYTVRSFFKYSDLPLGFIPSGSNLIQFHNKDISRSEILEILKLSNVRDRAAFCTSSQSGLRPSTIAALKLGDIEGILEQTTPIPCKITVRQESTKGKYSEYFSFMGKESVSYIKDYLKTRTEKLTSESYLFTKFGEKNEKEPVDPAVWTHVFERLINRLRKANVLDFKTERKELAVETKAKKPLRSYISRSEYRLYNLRKFFRKYAGQAGADYVNYWMGHLSALGSDVHYFSKDAEFHRKLYEQQAMPQLRLETTTSLESERQLTELRKELSDKTVEIKELRSRIEKLEPFITSVENLQKDQDALRLFVGSWLDDNLLHGDAEGTKGAEISDQLVLRLAEVLKKKVLTDLGLKELSKKQQNSK